MKLKNSIKVIALMGLCATGSTQPMMVGAALKKAAKWTLQKTGTFLGLGLATQYIPLTGLELYSLYKDPVSYLGETRAPSEEEETFLRQYIKNKNMTIRMLPSNRYGTVLTDMTVLDKATGISSHAIGASLSLSEALKQNNAQDLAIYAAIAQHETKHAEEKHFITDVASYTAIPLITTGIVATAFKKYFPANQQASLLKHSVRFGTKVVGGSLLNTVNGLIIDSVVRKARHWAEYRADKNIKLEEHKAGYIRHLAAAQNINNIAIQTAQNPKQIQETIAATHPPTEERIKRLQANSNKAA